MSVRFDTGKRSSLTMKVSCVCCTYGRFSFVRRSISFWLRQDYQDKELIIFNTASVPLSLDASISHLGIRVINQPVHITSGEAYTSLGMVRADALNHARGDVYICWDDDDMFLPWHISQGIEQLLGCGRGAWMPAQSYFSDNGGHTYQRCRNSLEASVLVRMEYLRKYGFDSAGKSGAEHLPWRTGLLRDGDLSEQDEVTPFESYAYIWGEAGHKTSGSIDEPGNFENHKRFSTDFGEGLRLIPKPAEEIEWLFENVYKSYPDPRLARKLNLYLQTKRLPVTQNLVQ